MSSTTKPFEEKMNASVNHLVHELASIRAGRANPAILDKVTVDYYGSPTPIQQIAAVAVAEARILTISPWDRSMLKPISKAIQTSDIGINPIDDGQVIRLVFPAPTEERRKQLTKDVKKQGEEAKTAVRNIRRDPSVSNSLCGYAMRHARIGCYCNTTYDRLHHRLPACGIAQSLPRKGTTVYEDPHHHIRCRPERSGCCSGIF